jgi:hypothetical protein
MDVLMLIQEARKAGLIMFPVGDRLEIRGPREAKQIVEMLRAQKGAVLAELSREAAAGGPFSLSRFMEWSELPGYCPGRRLIRNGIEHKRENCNGRRSWQHVWGGRFCSDCWPCTDPIALVPE